MGAEAALPPLTIGAGVVIDRTLFLRNANIDLDRAPTSCGAQVVAVLGDQGFLERGDRYPVGDEHVVDAKPDAGLNEDALHMREELPHALLVAVDDSRELGAGRAAAAWALVASPSVED